MRPLLKGKRVGARKEVKLTRTDAAEMEMAALSAAPAADKTKPSARSCAATCGGALGTKALREELNEVDVQGPSAL